MRSSIKKLTPEETTHFRNAEEDVSSLFWSDWGSDEQKVKWQVDYLLKYHGVSAALCDNGFLVGEPSLQNDNLAA
jgi:hypothetical protein